MGITLDSTKVVGHKVLDVGGNKIGSAGMVYHDHTSSHQDWVMVKGGLLGGRTHFAPLSGASMVADDVRLAYDKAMIDSAPEMDGNRELSAEEELALYRHYGLGSTAGLPEGVAGPPPVPPGVPDLTLPQYASLRVELHGAAGQQDAVLARYGLRPDTQDALHAYWRARFDADPLLRMMFAKAYATYVAWLRDGAGKGPQRPA